MKNKDTIANYVRFMRELKRHEGKIISASGIAKAHNVYPSTVLIMDKIGYAKSESKGQKGTLIHRVNYTDPSATMAESLLLAVNNYITGKLNPAKRQSKTEEAPNASPKPRRQNSEMGRKSLQSDTKKEKVGIIRRFFKWIY